MDENRNRLSIGVAPAVAPERYESLGEVSGKGAHAGSGVGRHHTGSTPTQAPGGASGAASTPARRP
jgi:hypothetical protein